MSNNVYFQLQFVKGNRNVTGSVLQLAPSKSTGDLLITIAPQMGYENNLPKFDYNSKAIFNLSELEIAQVSDLYNSRQEGKVNFPHMNARDPKTIIFENSVYNGNLQFKLTVIRNGKAISFFFSKAESDVFMKNLEDSVSMYNKMNAMLVLREFQGEQN